MTQSGHRIPTTAIVTSYSQMSKLNVAIDDLVNLVEKYRQRKYDDDIEYIEKNLRGKKTLNLKRFRHGSSLRWIKNQFQRWIAAYRF